jgi:hypothetical protein
MVLDVLRILEATQMQNLLYHPCTVVDLYPTGLFVEAIEFVTSAGVGGFKY